MRNSGLTWAQILFAKGLSRGWPKQDRSRRRPYDSAEFVLLPALREYAVWYREKFGEIARMVRLSVWETPSK